MNKDSAKYIFVREVLERTMRLSYYEKIQKSVPNQFYSLLPEKPIPNYKYELG